MRLELARSKIRLPQIPRAWLEAERRRASPGSQLLEKALKDPNLKQRLLQRVTLGWTTGEQAFLNEIGYDAYLERQLDYESIDTDPLEEALNEAFPTLSMSTAELYSRYDNEPEVPAFELLLATLYRSVYSPRQLLERMVVFWSDHFNIDLFSDFAYYLKPVDDREVIRRHALGTFPDLLRASGKSPAMLVYLTNDTNVKEHPNENYARELMELHTLGADRGYTQEDVREVARALTGWTVKGFEFGDELGEFLFNPAAHDTGRKVVLGRVLPAGRGIRDGEDVFDLLAEHPNTADIVSRKLLRYMWGYDPSQERIEKLAGIYLDTGGDIRAMLREILKRASMKVATNKLKRPYHLVVSTVRALEAEIIEPFDLLATLYSAGHLPFTWSPPNGFPDGERFWAPFLLPRLNFSAEFLNGPVGLDAPALNPEANPNLTRAKVRGRLNRKLLAGRMSGPTKTAIRDYLNAVPLNVDAVRDAVGLAVASPDFQYY